MLHGYSRRYLLQVLSRCAGRSTLKSATVAHHCHKTWYFSASMQDRGSLRSGDMKSSIVEPSPTVQPSLVPPPVVQPGIEALDATVTLSEDTVFPAPGFATSYLDERKRQVPQCIAHRGYKAKFPENTLLAFREAVSAGAQALETDVHLTKDDVVVLSHDANLKRCFGRKDKILDSTWAEIKDLRTLAAPHVPMPRLSELLQHLSEPGQESIWLLLDIKLSNDADTVMRLIAKTINEVEPRTGRPWNERVVLGLWAAKFLPLAAKYLPGFPVMHIGFKPSYARNFFDTPNVGFNMLINMMIAPGGKSFIAACQKKHDRQLLGWTINDREKMQWCIRRQFDGVITDDPSLFIEVREDYDENSKEPMIPVGFRTCFEILRIYLMITAFFFMFRKRFAAFSDQKLGVIKKVPR